MSMIKRWMAGVAAAGLLLLPTIVNAQGRADADTVRVEGERVVILVEDDAVVIREGRRAPHRELRVERRVAPDGIWMMHRDREGADTISVNVEGIARVVERLGEMPMHFERWVEGLEEAAPIGDTWQAQREIAEMEARSRELARQVRSAEGAEQERLEQELRAHLDELFSEKLALRRERVERLAERLEREQSELETRRNRRSEIVERRYRELLGEQDELDW